jgi:hypothetical protein
VSRPTRGHRGFLPVRGCHPLWPDFPDGSGSYLDATGLVRVRSPLLAESRLMSFPPGTEMFQFPGFASATYGFSDGYSLRSGLPHSEIPGSKPARGSPRLFAACHVLHRLLAPRHPPDALAFLHPRQPPPQTQPAATGTNMPARTDKIRGGDRRRRIPATTTTKGRSCAERPAYPCQMRALPKRRKDQEEGAERATCRCPSRTTHEGSLLHARDGHLITTSRCPNSIGLPQRSLVPSAGTPGGPGPT